MFSFVSHIPTSNTYSKVIIHDCGQTQVRTTQTSVSMLKLKTLACAHVRARLQTYLSVTCQTRYVRSHARLNIWNQIFNIRYELPLLVYLRSYLHEWLKVLSALTAFFFLTQKIIFLMKSEKVEAISRQVSVLKISKNIPNGKHDDNDTPLSTKFLKKLSTLDHIPSIINKRERPYRMPFPSSNSGIGHRVQFITDIDTSCPKYSRTFARDIFLCQQLVTMKIRWSTIVKGPAIVTPTQSCWICDNTYLKFSSGTISICPHSSNKSVPRFRALFIACSRFTLSKKRFIQGCGLPQGLACVIAQQQHFSHLTRNKLYAVLCYQWQHWIIPKKRMLLTSLVHHSYNRAHKTREHFP